MIDYESDEEFYELIRLYEKKVNEKNKESGNAPVITYNILSAISILLKAKSTILDEPWIIEQNGDCLIQFDIDLPHCSKVLNENNEYIPKTVETESNNTLNTTSDVNINDENIQQLLKEETRFWAAKRMKCLQDSDIEVATDPDLSIANVELLYNKNVEQKYPLIHDNKYISIENLFVYYNKLYLNNFQLNRQRHNNEELSVPKTNVKVLSSWEVNLFDEIIAIMFENTDSNSNIENSKYFIGYPCLNPDIVYNIILNNHYTKMDLLVDNVIRTPDDQIIRNECQQLCPIPQVKHMQKVFTEKERVMFVNGISNKQYNIDYNNCNKVMINLALVIIAHAGFDIANKQCLNVLANVAITYIKKIAIIMKKYLDTQSKNSCPDITDHTYNTFSKIDVKNGVSEMFKAFENDIVDRRNKLMKDCEQLQNFINHYLINYFPVVDKIKNEYITFEDMKLKNVNEPVLVPKNEENVTSKENNSDVSINTKVKQTGFDNKGIISLVDLANEHVCINHGIRKKILKFIIEQRLKSMDHSNDKKNQNYEDLINSIFKENETEIDLNGDENVSTKIEIKQSKPDIDGKNNLFNASTSSDPNYIEYINVNTTSTNSNVIGKNKNVLLEDKKTEIESKTEENELMNVEIKQTKHEIDNKNTTFKPSIFIDTKLVEFMLTDKTYPNKICRNFILNLLNSRIFRNDDKPLIHYLSRKNNNIILKNKSTVIESKTEGNGSINAEIDNTYKHIKLSTSSNPTSVDYMKSDATYMYDISIHKALDKFLNQLFDMDMNSLIKENNEEEPLKDSEIKSHVEKNVSTEIKQTKPKIDNTNKIYKPPGSSYSHVDIVNFFRTDTAFSKSSMKKDQKLKCNETEGNTSINIEMKQTEPKIDNTYKRIELSALLDPNGVECMKASATFTNDRKMQYSRYTYITKKTNTTDVKKTIKKYDDNMINSDFLKSLQFEEDFHYTYSNNYSNKPKFVVKDQNDFMCSSVNDRESQDTKMASPKDIVNCDAINPSTLSKTKPNSFNLDIMDIMEEDFHYTYSNNYSNKPKSVVKGQNDFMCSSVNDRESQDTKMASPKDIVNCDAINPSTLSKTKPNSFNLDTMDIMEEDFHYAYSNNYSNKPKSVVKGQNDFMCSSVNDRESQDTKMASPKDIVNCDAINPSTLSKTKPNSFNLDTIKKIQKNVEPKINNFDDDYDYDFYNVALNLLLKNKHDNLDYEDLDVEDFDDDFKHWKDSQVKNKTSDHTTLTQSNEHNFNNTTLVQAKIKQHTLNKMIKIYNVQQKKKS